MAIEFTWDTNYESLPGAALAQDALDNTLRKMRRGVRGIMEREHNWGPYTDKDDGSHITGATTVMSKLTGSLTSLTTGDVEGALLYRIVSGAQELYVNISATWTKVSNIEHGLLNNLLQDHHTQYVLLAGDTMSGALDMGGFELINSSAPAIGYDSNFVYLEHMDDEHGDFGAESVITDGVITYPRLSLYTVSYAGTIPPGFLTLYGSSGRWGSHINFVPNFYASHNEVQIIPPAPGGGSGIGLYNSGASATYRVNLARLV